MKIKIVKNRYLNALLLLLLFSAIFHVIILFYIAATTGNVLILNYFTIVDVAYFSPEFFGGVFGSIISAIFVIVLYLGILLMNNIE